MTAPISDPHKHPGYLDKLPTNRIDSQFRDLSNFLKFKNWHLQLPCLTLSIKGTMWGTSRQVDLLCQWKRHLTRLPHFKVADRWPATPKRARRSDLIDRFLVIEEICNQTQSSVCLYPELLGRSIIMSQPFLTVLARDLGPGLLPSTTGQGARCPSGPQISTWARNYDQKTTKNLYQSNLTT